MKKKWVVLKFNIMVEWNGDEMKCKTQVEESNSEEDFLAKYLDPKDRTRRIPVKITFFCRFQLPFIVQSVTKS